jgi:hypothetical protein
MYSEICALQRAVMGGEIKPLVIVTVRRDFPRFCETLPKRDSCVSTEGSDGIELHLLMYFELLLQYIVGRRECVIIPKPSQCQYSVVQAPTPGIVRSVFLSA